LRGGTASRTREACHGVVQGCGGAGVTVTLCCEQLGVHALALDDLHVGEVADRERVEVVEQLADGLEVTEGERGIGRRRSSPTHCLVRAAHRRVVEG
jgi:hypothetical protein